MAYCLEFVVQLCFLSNSLFSGLSTAPSGQECRWKFWTSGGSGQEVPQRPKQDAHGRKRFRVRSLGSSWGSRLPVDKERQGIFCHKPYRTHSPEVGATFASPRALHRRIASWPFSQRLYLLSGFLGAFRV